MSTLCGAIQWHPVNECLFCLDTIQSWIEEHQSIETIQDWNMYKKYHVLDPKFKKYWKDKHLRNKYKIMS